MAINAVPLTPLPTPPLKTDPANFAERADTFVSALPGLVTETNAMIGEVNKITSGLDQATPIVAWAAGTTYNFPDVVAGTDGYSYRCVTTACVGVDPTTDDGSNWVNVGSGSSIVGSLTVSGNAFAIPRFLHIVTAVCTLTLPAAPQVNSVLSVINLSGAITPVIDPGAEKINGVGEPMTMDILNSAVNLIYSGATYGWILL